jgi:hypothetical protein
MLVADLHHFLDLAPETPSPARRLGEHLASIVAAATAGDAHTAWKTGSAVPTPTGQPPLPRPDHRDLHPTGCIRRLALQPLR